jgi:ribonuclease HII
MLKIRYTEDEVIEVGIDEAGRGCFWGPMYAGAVIWAPEDTMNDEQREVAGKIKDSKKLTPKRRIALAEAIKKLAVEWSVGAVQAAEIDEIGMTKSNQLAFVRALTKLSSNPERLLIDGILSIYDAPWSFKEQIVEPEMDGHYVPVAAASILAKVSHDEWVAEYCTRNEHIAERYDLLSNKGYGTARHRAGIVEYGHTKEHRQTFLRKLYAGRAVKDVAELTEE